MAIKVECGECGQEYKVKDELEGKKIRCKACSSTILVRSAEDEWDDSIDEEEYAPPVKKKSTAKKKSKRRSSSGGMPPTIIIALVCLGVMMAVSVLDAIGVVLLLSKMAVRPPQMYGMIFGSLFRGVVQLSVFVGVLKGTASTRTISIVLSALAALMFTAQFFRRSGPLGEMDQLTLAIIGFSVLARVVYIGCMLTSSADDHMRH